MQQAFLLVIGGYSIPFYDKEGTHFRQWHLQTKTMTNLPSLAYFFLRSFKSKNSTLRERLYNFLLLSQKTLIAYLLQDLNFLCQAFITTFNKGTMGQLVILLVNSVPQEAELLDISVLTIRMKTVACIINTLRSSYVNRHE